MLPNELSTRIQILIRDISLLFYDITRTGSLQEVNYRLSKFTKKGVSLITAKEPAASRPIVDIAPLSQVTVPLLSASGDSLRSAVKINQTVLQGDLLGLAEPGAGYPVYAPVSGLLVGFREIQHPLLGNVSCAVLNCTIAGSKYNKQDQRSVDKSADYIKLAQTMGIIDELDGMPLAKKLAQWKKINSVCLVADASEQEPYSSSAWSVLNESTAEVEKGLELISLAIQASSRHIAVMQPKANYKKLKSLIKNTDLLQVSGKYPAKLVSGAKNICRVGVQACLALYHAVEYNRPPCNVVVTVTGDAVTNAQNVRVPIGTLVDDVLHFCRLSPRPEYVIIGDAMTGNTINRTDIPIVPGITCIIALKACPRSSVHPCIGCGRCVSACHAGLLPYEIMRRLDNMQYERLASLLAEECDGCGACSYVCPSGLDVAAKVIEAKDAHGNIFLKWGNGDDI